MEAPLMQIGGVTKESMGVAAEAIVKVATCSPDPKVVVKALEVLMRLGETNQVTVQGCNLTGASGPAMGVAPAVVKSDYFLSQDSGRGLA